MSKFIKTALSNFSNLFQTNDNNTTINTNAYTIPPMHQENNENINNDDTIDFDSLFGSTENITATNEKDLNNSDESKSITPEEVGATIAVGTTSVLSGVAKIIEYIDDGVAWAGGKVTEGASWLVGETAGLFSENAKDSIMKWRENVKKNVKNETDRDKVGELNEWLYENTKIGQDINDASYLKYDSAAAKTTQNVSTKIGEIGGATALTILTGGAAAPLVFGVGCAEGFGKTAEATYQNGGDFDDGTLSIMLSGGLNGMSWVANGKLVQGAFEIIKDAASVGLLETGSTILNDTLLNKKFWSNTIKNGLSLRTISSSGNSVVNVNALMNYGTSLMSIGGDFVDVLNSDEGFTPKNIMILGTRYLTALGLNVLEDSGREYITSYKAGKIANTLSEEKFIDTEFEDIPEPISATIGMQKSEKLDDTLDYKTEEIKQSQFDEVEDTLGSRKSSVEQRQIEAINDSKKYYLYKDNSGNIVSNLPKKNFTARGIDSTTNKLIPIDYLFKVIEDPEYTQKVLDGNLSDKIDGFQRLEIGNALNDLKTSIEKNNLDLELDEGSLERMNKCISEFSGNPYDLESMLNIREELKNNTYTDELSDADEFVEGALVNNSDSYKEHLNKKRIKLSESMKKINSMTDEELARIWSPDVKISDYKERILKTYFEKVLKIDFDNIPDNVFNARIARFPMYAWTAGEDMEKGLESVELSKIVGSATRGQGMNIIDEIFTERRYYTNCLEEMLGKSLVDSVNDSTVRISLLEANGSYFVGEDGNHRINLLRLKQLTGQIDENFVINCHVTHFGKVIPYWEDNSWD